MERRSRGGAYRVWISRLGLGAAVLLAGLIPGYGCSGENAPAIGGQVDPAAELGAASGEAAIAKPIVTLPASGARKARSQRRYGRRGNALPVPAAAVRAAARSGVPAATSSSGVRTSSAALTSGVALSVVGPAGEAIAGYRWLIEEDATYNIVPGAVDPHAPSVSFHKSYMPVVAHGTNLKPPSSGILLEPSKRYFISVLPNEGYTMGGTRFLGADASVTVRCTKAPLATAQMSVFVFEDSSPINAAPDLPEERGLAGFQVNVWEAGGRYGAAGGQVMQDVFANPIGTTYNPDGTPNMMGAGYAVTDENGYAIIKNLAQGKFTIKIIPPRGQGWIQTTTIEGGKGNDAWIKPNEPVHFQEFGPPGPHVFFGFVKEMSDATVLKSGKTISGQIVNLRQSRPPNYVFNAGEPFQHTTPYVGLNDMSTGNGRGVFAKKCNPDGSFVIPNVPAGNYQLVVWDSALDLIIANHTIVMGGNKPLTDLNLGKVPVFQWFGQLRNFVFYDANGNGIQDPGEPGLPGVPVNIRWRDGSIYATNTTDASGMLAFNEVFPFFAWQVAEVDVSRLKATGATAVVDNGGPADKNDPWSFGGLVSPQPQPSNGNKPYRTDLGAVKTQAFQSFIGTTNVIQWGKKEYAPGENGGISGGVWYDQMRGADDARNTGQELIEPGIPRVQVNLYLDGKANVKADVDNWPYGNFPGPEDIDWNGNGVFDKGDAIAVTHSVGWDDNLPTQCPGDPFVFHGVPTDCYDGLRVFNQVRPGVYDGMYKFDGIPSGTYIVEVVPPKTPAGDTPYEITKEENQNLDFGDEYTPTTQTLPPECVGELHRVPDELTLFPGVTPRLAGQDQPLCDRKKVVLNDGQNGAVDFSMFTEVPIASHIIGFILDDTTNEFDVNAPTFGEKYAPPWLPISIRDWDGVEIGRTYSDEYGTYNALVPSTHTMNNPLPSGVSPKMLTTCMNDPGPIPDPSHPGQWITDPAFNPQYSQFCYTLQYMPGTTTYLDTPVIPVAAFAGATTYPLDCEAGDGTPRIYSVSGPQGGPYVATTGQILTITAMGTTQVPNPRYDGQNGTQPRYITRDFGFGATRGTGSVRINGTLATVIAWSAGAITARVAPGTSTGELVVTRGNGKSTTETVTVTVGNPADTYQVIRVPTGGSIQSAIDAAAPGALILVPPGNYLELVVLWKPVRLQGWGPGSTTINAVKTPAEKLVAWRAKVMNLIQTGAVDLVPNQANGVAGPPEALEPLTLFNEEGPGIIVLSKNASVAQGGFGRDALGRPNARIDGFTITGGDNAGGIMVNGYAHYLVVSNNRIQSNAGTYGGGLRIGEPYLLNAAGTDYQSGFNDNIRIHHNNINRNGGIEAVGGGISLYTGTNSYAVEDNTVCGNFSGGHGGGIGHLGLSNGGTIARNTILFNENFFQQTSVHGGGIFIGGEAPVGAAGLSPGSGSVKVNANLIQGNGATSGEGGGIRVERANGLDVNANRNRPSLWHRIDITNNMIVNNVAGLAGGGISLQDAALVNILHNSIVHNDSTATAGAAFTPGSPNQSNPQPAGIVSRAHSPELRATMALVTTPLVPAKNKVFSNPLLVNDIIWQNRSFYFVVDPTLPAPNFKLLPDVAAGDAPVYSDLAVLGTPTLQRLEPQNCDLTSVTGYASSNFSGDPRFVAQYVNGAASQIALPGVTTSITPPAAFDEGGNFIKVRFGPITLNDPVTGAPLGNHHIQAGSAASARGMLLLSLMLLSPDPNLLLDYDAQARPLLFPRPDVGADQR